MLTVCIECIDSIDYYVDSIDYYAECIDSIDYQINWVSQKGND